MNQKEKIFLEEINLHSGIIHKVSRIYIDDDLERQDLYQEIVFQLWKSYDGFRQESKFSTWMYRIALNTAIIYFKKEKKYTINNLEYDKIQKLDTDSQLEDEELTLLYSSIQKLNKIEKALIFLYLEGLNSKDISKNLGISEVNARVKLHRAKEKLKLIINQNLKH